MARLAKSENSGVRDAAFEALRKIGGEKAVGAVQLLATNELSLQIRRAAVSAWVGLDLTNAAPAAVSLLRSATNADDSIAIWKSLLETKGAAPLLARALPQNGFPQVAGKAGLRAARETGHNDVELIVALTRASGLQDTETKLTDAETKALIKEIADNGDAIRGEKFSGASRSLARPAMASGVSVERLALI